MGVDASGNKDEGAGDQGIMFGYACRETDVLMPAPIHYSHKILRLMAEDRKSGKLKNIEPDSKVKLLLNIKMDSGKCKICSDFNTTFSRCKSISS